MEGFHEPSLRMKFRLFPLGEILEVQADLENRTPFALPYGRLMDENSEGTVEHLRHLFQYCSTHDVRNATDGVSESDAAELWDLLQALCRLHTMDAKREDRHPHRVSAAPRTACQRQPPSSPQHAQLQCDGSSAMGPVCQRGHEIHTRQQHWLRSSTVRQSHSTISLFPSLPFLQNWSTLSVPFETATRMMLSTSLCFAGIITGTRLHMCTRRTWLWNER